MLICTLHKIYYVSTSCAKLTIEQFVDEDKVIFYVLFRYFTKVRLHDINNFQKELKYHRGVHVLFGDSR